MLQQTITPECFGKVTPKRSNARILKGLISLSHEIKSQEQVERDTKLMQADIDAMHQGIYMSYGISYKQFSLNFRRWIALTKTTREEFAWRITKAIKNSYLPIKEQVHKDTIEFDGDALALHVDDIEIWFDAIYFEQHVGSQTITYDEGGTVTREIVVSAGEYLKENWKDLAADFILHNLNHAEISDDLIEELI